MLGLATCLQKQAKRQVFRGQATVILSQIEMSNFLVTFSALVKQAKIFDFLGSVRKNRGDS